MLKSVQKRVCLYIEVLFKCLKLVLAAQRNIEENAMDQETYLILPSHFSRIFHCTIFQSPLICAIYVSFKTVVNSDTKT
jgi:hypothetical protein